MIAHEAPPHTDEFTVTSLDELARLYEAPTERAVRKQIDRLDEHCRAFVAASPFLLLATSSEANGGDCSPRGDLPGFVAVADDRTLLVPDRRGNNRIDSLRNIVANPAVGLLFLVPGVNESLRVNGRAVLSTHPDLLARFEIEGKLPRTVLVVTVGEAFLQCARALVRADLWNPDKQRNRNELPSMGAILADHTRGFVDAGEYDQEAARILPTTLY